MSRNPDKVKHEPLGYLGAEGALSANTLGQERAGRVQRTAGRSLWAYSGMGGFAAHASEEWARLGSVTLKVMGRAVGFPSKRWEPQRVSDQGMILTDS